MKLIAMNSHLSRLGINTEKYLMKKSNNTFLYLKIEPKKRMDGDQYTNEVIPGYVCTKRKELKNETHEMQQFLSTSKVKGVK